MGRVLTEWGELHACTTTAIHTAVLFRVLAVQTAAVVLVVGIEAAVLVGKWCNTVTVWLVLETEAVTLVLGTDPAHLWPRL